MRVRYFVAAELAETGRHLGRGVIDSRLSADLVICDELGFARHGAQHQPAAVPVAAAYDRSSLGIAIH